MRNLAIAFIPENICPPFHCYLLVIQEIKSEEKEDDERTDCSLPIQVMTTGPLAAPSKLPRITGTCPGWWKRSFWLRLWSLVWFQVRATSCHLTPSKSAWKSTATSTWMRWRVWWSPGAIKWPVADPRCGSRTRRRPIKSKVSQAWLQKECYDFVPFSYWPPPPPSWTRWTTSFGHTSRTSPTSPPTTPKPAWSPPSGEYSPNSRRR